MGFLPGNERIPEVKPSGICSGNPWMGFSWESSSIFMVRPSMDIVLSQDRKRCNTQSGNYLSHGGKNEGNPNMFFVRQTRGRVFTMEIERFPYCFPRMGRQKVSLCFTVPVVPLQVKYK